jgi:hypothetical protein
MSPQASGPAVPGPGRGETARVLAGMVGDPLAGYVRLAARYRGRGAGAVRAAPRRLLLSRPEHAEHVLGGQARDTTTAAKQDSTRVARASVPVTQRR